MVKTEVVKTKLRDANFKPNTLNFIPTICGYCGSDLVVTPTLTGLSCSSPTCAGKRSNTLQSMLQKLGIKGYGSVFCYELAKNLDFALPTQLFVLVNQPRYVQNIPQAADLLLELGKYRKQTLANFLDLSMLPNIGTRLSQKIADGIYRNNLSPLDFFSNVTLTLVLKVLGITDPKSLTAINVTKQLTYYSKVLIQSYKFFDIIPPIDSNLEVITLVASDSVGGNFTKKQDFYDYIQQKFPNYNFQIKTSVTKDLDYLIWDGGRETTKVKKAQDYNTKGSSIKILDANEFLELFNLQ